MARVKHKRRREANPATKAELFLWGTVCKPVHGVHNKAIKHVATSTTEPTV